MVYYDMGQVVNTMSSKKANADLEVSDTDDDAAILKPSVSRCPYL